MTKAEQARVLAWRLKILRWAAEEPRQVARTCRHFGISRTAFYRWKRRFEERGEAGLADRPRTPRHCPRATPREVVSKILYLRQRYHFGPGRIAAYLQRFHEVRIACSSVHRILGKHGMSRLPANQKHQPHHKRWRRYEKPQPGHRLQMDVKFLERIPGTGQRLYPFTAIDDCRVGPGGRVGRTRAAAMGSPMGRRRAPPHQGIEAPPGGVSKYSWKRRVRSYFRCKRCGWVPHYKYRKKGAIPLQ